MEEQNCPRLIFFFSFTVNSVSLELLMISTYRAENDQMISTYTERKVRAEECQGRGRYDIRDHSAVYEACSASLRLLSPCTFPFLRCVTLFADFFLSFFTRFTSFARFRKMEGSVSWFPGCFGRVSWSPFRVLSPCPFQSHVKLFPDFFINVI